MLDFLVGSSTTRNNYSLDTPHLIVIRTMINKIATVMLVTTFMHSSMPFAQTPADAACPSGPFETAIDKISLALPPEQLCAKAPPAIDPAVPIEISRILTGGVSFFQGSLMNEGLASWYAFDVERNLFIAVITSTNEQSSRIPAVKKLSSNQVVRYTDLVGYRRAEFVTVMSATPIQVREFACLGNQLLATVSDPTFNRPLRTDTLKKSFSLLHHGQVLDVGKGQKRWQIQGIIENFISQPLQQLILPTYEP
jgi:hypothetical protein